MMPACIAWLRAALGACLHRLRPAADPAYGSPPGDPQPSYALINALDQLIPGYDDKPGGRARYE